MSVPPKYLAALILLASCATASDYVDRLAFQSAPETGCAPHEIQVVNPQAKHKWTWNAVCRGISYRCEATGGSRQAVCVAPPKVIMSRQSAGVVPCPPSKIQVSDIETMGNTWSWVATCGSTAYQCASEGPKEKAARCSKR
jgi:hypothetical protein